MTYTGMDFNRIADGRIVESWMNYDALALVQQAGLVAPIKGVLAIRMLRPPAEDEKARPPQRSSA